MRNKIELNGERRSSNTLTREWLDLHELTMYAAVCERTVRGWIHSSVDPLPATRVGGKILVRKSDIDRWLERHRMKPAGELDLGGIVKEVLEGIGDGR